MGSNQDKGEKKGSSLLQVISGLRRRRKVLLLFSGILLSAIASIVLITFELPILAISCLGLLIIFCLLVIRDIVRSSEESENRIKEIKDILEQKEEYLSSFSHRIRTPLNNFSFIIDYLMEKNPEGSQKEMLETLIASTTNMVEAVNDLTMKSAQEISYVPRKDIKFNFFAALSSTVELFEANTNNIIRFKLEKPDSPDKHYLGDPITVKQIFLDLFNTIAAAEGSPSFVSIGLTEENKSKDKDHVRVDINTDLKIQGFKISDSENIPGDSRAGKLIKSINGTYSSNVAEDHSVFTFTMPLVIAPEEESQSKAAERIKELKTETRKQKSLADASILLVEDNPTNQKIVLITLKSLVKNIDTAVTGKEALDMFGLSNYDIILMDIQLPVMDGITAARKIREIEVSTSLRTPIIAITANAMIGDKEKCLSAGMDEYLSKPFQPSELIKLIEKHVTS